jgi:hypothetical protein
MSPSCRDHSIRASGIKSGQRNSELLYSTRLARVCHGSSAENLWNYFHEKKQRTLAKSGRICSFMTLHMWLLQIFIIVGMIGKSKWNTKVQVPNRRAWRLSAGFWIM